MKTINGFTMIRTCLWSLRGIALMVGTFFLLGTPPRAAAEPPADLSASDQIALNYVKDPKANGDLTKYLTSLGLLEGKAQFLDVTARVEAMLRVVDSGVVIDSPVFWADYRGLVPVSKNDIPAKATTPLTPSLDPRVAWVPYASFHLGTRALAPYKITQVDATNGRIESNATDTQGFLEFVFKNTWAWQPLKVEAAKSHPSELNGLQVVAFNKWFSGDAFDYSARLGYEFGSSDQPSASTITGSGDFSAEFTLEKQILRGWSNSTSYSLNLFGSWSGVTDRAALRIHNRWLVGPSINFGFDVPAASNRRALFALRAGLYSRIDQVVRGPLTTSTYTDDKGVSTTATYRPVVMEDGHPRYKARANSTALEAELHYPISDSTYLTLTGNLYGHMDPDLWNVSVGVTFPLSKLTAAFNADPATTPKK